MSVIDLWAERYIQEALSKGELSNLNGEGKALQLEDDSLVPPELRAGYRLLKNSGYLPAELQQRKDALTLSHMLKGLSLDDPNYASLSQQLALLELKLKQANVNTDFLHSHYADAISEQIANKSNVK
ncbi:DnaJ family domain-containing protein [Providencia sp. Me31A]|uniref:DnaJ family domain-containing protein n=1 Tax=Providencia sp. Me31A TaxID=3392637 RepID=UPI003D2C74C3